MHGIFTRQQETFKHIIYRQKIIILWNLCRRAPVSNIKKSINPEPVIIATRRGASKVKLFSIINRRLPRERSVPVGPGYQQAVPVSLDLHPTEERHERCSASALPPN
jgi:hypothetical protein